MYDWIQLDEEMVISYLTLSNICSGSHKRYQKCFRVESEKTMGVMHYVGFFFKKQKNSMHAAKKALRISFFYILTAKCSLHQIAITFNLECFGFKRSQVVTTGFVFASCHGPASQKGLWVLVPRTLWARVRLHPPSGGCQSWETTW